MKYMNRLAAAALGLCLSLYGKNVAPVAPIPAGFERAPGGAEFAVKGLRYHAATFPSGFRVLIAGEDGQARTVNMSIENGNAEAAVRPSDKLPVRTNYLVGPRDRWRTSVDLYGRLRYEDVLPGIDIEYRPWGDQLEFDFILRQGADPGDIVLRYRGQDGLSIDRDGSLVVKAGGGELVQQIPAIYQRTPESMRLVSGRYEIRTGGEVRFILGPYDNTMPLVIDPVITYSGFIKGTGSTVANSFARDAQGRWYIGGYTGAADLPVIGNAPQNARGGDIDGFVARIDPNYPGGPTVTDLTYFGGSGTDQIYGMTLDASGVVYITGVTQSTNLPVSASAKQPTLGGSTDAFFAKINLDVPAGQAMVYCTYLGGSDVDMATAIQVDSAGLAYITGYTNSTNFPTAGSAFQSGAPGGGNAFLSQYDASGNLAYSTYLGGGGSDVARALALAPDGSVYIAGTTYSGDFPVTGGAYNGASSGGGDGFLVKLSPASGLIYSTYLGGSGAEDVKAMGLNAAGQIVLTGWTVSQDFPVTATPYQSILRGGTDLFVSVLDPAQPGSNALVYSTLVGGSDTDVPYGLAIDGGGQILVTGYTYSSADFPTTANAFQATDGGAVDAFLVRLDPTQQGAASLVYGTYLGGAGNDIGYTLSLDSTGTIFIIGSTSSSQFPNVASADPRQHTPGAPDAFLLGLQP